MCALNTILGKQNHSATFFDAWTDCTLEHLRKHSGHIHRSETCKEIKFLSLEDLEHHLTQHSLNNLPQRKTGRLHTIAQFVMQGGERPASPLSSLGGGVPVVFRLCHSLRHTMLRSVTYVSSWQRGRFTAGSSCSRLSSRRCLHLRHHLRRHLCIWRQ